MPPGHVYTTRHRSHRCVMAVCIDVLWLFAQMSYGWLRHVLFVAVCRMSYGWLRHVLFVAACGISFVVVFARH
jgi:hypothetical protein